MSVDERPDGGHPNIHVRVCVEHGIRLEERPGDKLWCPWRRGHYAKTWKVVDVKKGQALALAGADDAHIGELREKHVPQPRQAQSQGSKPGQKRTVTRAKFSGGGEDLWIRLLQVVSRFGGDPFRVTWEVHRGDRKSGKTAAFGVVSTHADSTTAQKRFEETRSEAAKAGWKEAAILPGRRPIEFKPIPKPGSLRRG